MQVSILTSVHAYVFSIGSEILERDCFLAKSNHCGELKYLNLLAIHETEQLDWKYYGFDSWVLKDF